MMGTPQTRPLIYRNPDFVWQNWQVSAGVPTVRTLNPKPRILHLEVYELTIWAAGCHDVWQGNPKQLLGGSWDLVSRLIMGITEVIIWIIGVTCLLTKPP